MRESGRPTSVAGRPRHERDDLASARRSNPDVPTRTFMKNSISAMTWVQLGSISGGEVISSDSY